ncbi:MAG: adenylosuccinate synthetase [Candidatus Vogelbacteria bacterium]|nr:adenylosuccinate synthetase [Candidatus Vogelbacteria bacterium]
MTKAIIICDLGLGDGGKGTIVDFLTRKLHADLIVRHNGGPQAAHNVVNSGGIGHCFASFGSGMLVPGTKTLLSSKMLISPDAFLNEGEALKTHGVADIFERTFVGENCPIITPWHTMVGQLLELERGDRRHGSCGMGFGQAVYDNDAGKALLVRDLARPTKFIRAKLKNIFDAKRQIALGILRRGVTNPNFAKMQDRFNYFMNERIVDNVYDRYHYFNWKMGRNVVLDQQFLARDYNTIIFEGAQGALLDREYGFAPYITKSKTTYHNAKALLNQSRTGAQMHKLGIIRAYGHRHGAGPFPTESRWLGSRLCDELNKENVWQGKFRIGWLDIIMLRYGAQINDGVDSLCVTCLDQLSGLKEIKVCVSYKYLGSSKDVEKYFVTSRYFSGDLELTDIKRSFEGREEVARILMDCKPNYITLPGWTIDHQPKNFEDLPENAKTFLQFLESKVALGAPISIISFGPQSDQKIIVSDSLG